MRDRTSTKKKSSTPIKSRRRRSGTHCKPIDPNSHLTWTPDLIGPVFTNEKISLRQALQTHLTDKRTRLMASFVPDELIYALDLTKKNFREFFAVLLLVDISGFNHLWEKYNCAENNGSNGFSSILNFCVSLMVENVYSFEGDIINITAEEVLAMWKVRKDDFVAKTIDTVIACALRIKQVLKDFGNESKSLTKVKMAISSGPVIFSVIGDENGRNFVLVGNPVVQVRNMKKDHCLPGDLVVTLNTWENVYPQNYEYVLQDAHNVKIMGSSGFTSKSNGKSGTGVPVLADKFPPRHQRDIETSQEEIQGAQTKDSNILKLNTSMEVSDLERKIFTGRFSMTEATRRKLGNHLKSFTIEPVLRQIEKDLYMEQLTENRRVMVMAMDLEPRINSVYELLTLIDECYVLLHRIATDHSGCLSFLNIRDKAIHFVMAFGSGSNSHDEARNGLLCAASSVKALKNISGIDAVAVGISTGTLYCGVIGHLARMNYVMFGQSVEKANEITLISNEKIMCDLATIIHSGLSRNQFYSRGLRELRGLRQCHLYQLMNGILMNEESEDYTYSDYVYPLLGRFQELDIFTDILDDICSQDRKYCGFLVEGPERIGKSRLLDDFVRIARSRQISVCKLYLDESDVSKPYVTVYNLLVQLLDAKDCKTEEERERLFTKKICSVGLRDDFCYMNIISRISFPLSSNYQSENEEIRLAKSLKLFEAILQSIRKPKCVIMDNVQFIDRLSWPFISRLLNNNNMVLVMSLQKPISSENHSQSNISIFKDKRVYRHELKGLESDNLGALVCQLLNVDAITRKLDNILRSRSQNHPGWCEAFITLMLQNESLKLVSLTTEQFPCGYFTFSDPSLITKIPKDLSPEETSPEFSYRRKKGVKVCLMNNEFMGNVDLTLTFDQILSEIYNRSTTYEKNLMQCASILGKAFTRNALENILPGHKSQDTAKAVARMIDLRILECASLQRRDYQIDDSTLCVHKNRTNFSDMHHIIDCTCPRSVTRVRNLPQQSRCKLLEFKCNSFKKTVASTLDRKNEFVLKFVEIYERNARKCAACGGGSFFKMPGREKPITVETSTFRAIPRKIPLEKNSSQVNRKKRSFLTVSEDESRIQSKEMEFRKISIMPTHSDTDEESISSFESERMTVCIESLSGVKEDKNLMEFRRKISTNLTMSNDPSRVSHLKNFNHIDYRNCQCIGIVDCLFWELYQQLKTIENFERLARFVIDYGAGLIQTGQSFQAIKLLTTTYNRIEYSRDNVGSMENRMEATRMSRGPFLVLMGDASVKLGNYMEARKYYDEAVRLCINSKCSFEKFCISYRILDQACKQKFHERYPDSFVNRITGHEVATRISVAVYLSRLSTVLLRAGESSAAKLTALESFDQGFACSGNFLEKCDIYLKIVNVFSELGDFAFAKNLEKPMIHTIRSKQWWSDVEEVRIVAIVFKSIFEMRLLEGEYEDALIMGIKVLKISTALKMSGTKLSILPQLIQLTIRTKRIHETVDLMRTLYHSASEDIDESGITWYFALALDLALDAGMILESFENCACHAQKMIGTSNLAECIFRDSDSLRRLLTCIWLWQLRMSILPTFAQYTASYTSNVRADNFNHLLTVSKALECHFLTLTRCINMKRADQLGTLVQDIERLVRILEKHSRVALFIRPRLYMFKGYLEIVRGRRLKAMRYLKKAAKSATNQSNPLMLAWIRQNETMWRLNKYNNMAHYWVEHVGFNDTVDWQNMHCFNIKTWSSMLFPIPIPDTYI